MRTFRCDHCGNALFFENISCLQCGSALAFLPDRMDLCSIEPAGGQDGWYRRKAGAHGGETGTAAAWRLCDNHTRAQACNFAIPAHDDNPLCVSCRLTRVLPDLSVADNFQRWYRIETAKRRLFFTLARLGLVLAAPAAGQRQGPVFEFKADMPGEPVITGHVDRIITLNIAEADDEERVRRRVALHEPYRTLLGHLRHESGHYYWDVMIERRGRHEEFRRVFGDERADYAQALSRHYDSGGQPAGRQDTHVSAYATAHPWEDWAETWAHYLHMVDLLETAASFSARMVVPGVESEKTFMDPFAGGEADFDGLVEQWAPLTVMLNSLNRSLGQEDAYPFALSPPALDKLRFVHDFIQDHARQAKAHPAPPPDGC
jgi:hypothetical protein